MVFQISVEEIRHFTHDFSNDAIWTLYRVNGREFVTLKYDLPEHVPVCIETSCDYRIQSTNAGVNNLSFLTIFVAQMTSVKENGKSFLTLTSFYLFRVHTFWERYTHTLYNVSKKY